jgi:hypothetical protein
MDGIVLVNYQMKKGVRLKKIPALKEKMSLTEKNASMLDVFV